MRTIGDIPLSNTEDGQPVWVRVKAYDSYGNYQDGIYLENFQKNCSDDFGNWYLDDDGYWCYNKILYPGEVTTELSVEVAYDGPERTENNGDAGRIAIVYDFIPIEYDFDGNPLPADWNLQYNETLSLNSEDSLIQPIASAKGGTIIDLGGPDLKTTGKAYYVERCEYNWDYDDSYNGLTVTNKADVPEPPDNPGVELPETGGIGTIWFTVTGVAMITIASIFMVRKKRRSR